MKGALAALYLIVGASFGGTLFLMNRAQCPHDESGMRIVGPIIAAAMWPILLPAMTAVDRYKTTAVPCDIPSFIR